MRLIIIFTLVALFFNTVAFSAEPGFTNKEAKAFIEKLWNTDSFSIKLGSITVVDRRIAGEPKIAENRISEELYETYQTWKKLGIFRISIVKTYGSSGSDSDMFAHSLGGLRKEILIEKTDLGETLVKRDGLPQKDGWLVMKTGIYRVDEIVKNEARQKGADSYRIIMATYTAECTPEFKRAMEMIGRKISEKRKVIMLIKFDPFSSTWKNVTYDIANRDEDFSTNYVSRALAE
jgi:hypothetical protein